MPSAGERPLHHGQEASCRRPARIVLFDPQEKEPGPVIHYSDASDQQAESVYSIDQPQASVVLAAHLGGVIL